MIGGHQLARASMGASAILAGRPFIEGHVRRRVRELPEVTLIDGCDALGLTTSRDGERVTGVRILRRADGSAEETLAADLVVAATGRAARVPAWLEALGYPRPEEERLDVDVTYASRRLSLPADPLGGDKFVLIGARPGHPRTLFLFAQEGGRWILGLGGYGPAHRPPSDPEGFAAFAATVAPPDVLEAIEAAEPARRDRDAPLPRQRPPPLRPPAQLPGGAAGRGRRDLLVQPHLRARDDGRRRPGGRAARLPRARRARPRPPLLQRRQRPDRSRLGAVGRRRPGAARGRGAAVRARAPRSTPICAGCARRPSTTPPSPGPSVAVVGMRERPPHVLRPAIAVRVARGPRAAVAGASGSKGCAVRELRVGELRTPLREAGPPDASRGRRLPARQPGLERGLGAAARRHGPPLARRGLGRPGIRSRRRSGRVSADRRGTRASSSAARSTRSGSSASISSPTTSAGPGASRGQPASPTGSPARSCSAPARCPAIAGTRSRGSGAPRTPASCSWPRRPASASACCCGAATRAGFRGRSSTACTTTSTARTRRAVLELYRSVPDVAGAGERLAQALRPLDRPALVLWGRHDPYIPVDNAERQRAAFPRAEIRVLERSGHWPFVDDPATVTAALTGFLAKARRRARATKPSAELTARCRHDQRRPYYAGPDAPPPTAHDACASCSSSRRTTASASGR